MAYQIQASVCQHVIRSSDHLPWSGSTLDFDVQYCSECIMSQCIREERRVAEREYNAHHERVGGERSRRDREYTDARRRYDKSRVASAEDEEYQRNMVDNDRMGRGLPTVGEEAGRLGERGEALHRQLRALSGRDRTARFADEELLRRESQVRDQERYDRSSSSYEAGAHADRSENGYYDTADPYANDNDEELEDRRDRAELRRLQEALKRYR